MNHIDSRRVETFCSGQKMFFRRGSHIAISTVQSWMREKILSPIRKLLRAVPQGSPCDNFRSHFPELAEHSILAWYTFHAFFARRDHEGHWVAGYNSNREERRDGHTLCQSHAQARRKSTSIQGDLPATAPSATNLETESINYNARIWIRTYTGDSVKRFITFFPSSESSEVTKILAHNDDGWGVDTIINIRPHLEYIKGKMDTN